MNRLAKLFSASVILLAATSALAQPAPGGQGGGGPGGPGGGGMGGPGRMGGGGPMMRGGMPGMLPPNALDDVVGVVAELNLHPGFTLSEDQKTKIQAIRDALKKAQDKWREDNAAELKQIQDTMTSLREQGPDADREAFRDVMMQNMELMQTAPNGNDEAEQVKAVLTSEQAKVLAEKEKEIDAERQKMWQQMGGGGRGPGGGGGGPGGRDGGRNGGGQGGQGAGKPGV